MEEMIQGVILMLMPVKLVHPALIIIIIIILFFTLGIYNPER